jgi:hypothetical protein
MLTTITPEFYVSKAPLKTNVKCKIKEMSVILKNKKVKFAQ